MTIVRYFAPLGCRIAVLDINAGGSEVVKQLSGEFPQSSFLFKQCDVSSWKSQADAFADVYQQHGRIDVVMANAGITQSVPLLPVEDEPSEPNLKTLNVNLVGVIYCT